MVGQFTLATAITGPIFMFTGLQLRSLLATEISNEISLGAYIRLRILLGILSISTTPYFYWYLINMMYQQK